MQHLKTTSFLNYCQNLCISHDRPCVAGQLKNSHLQFVKLNKNRHFSLYVYLSISYISRSVAFKSQQLTLTVTSKAFSQLIQMYKVASHLSELVKSHFVILSTFWSLLHIPHLSVELTSTIFWPRPIKKSILWGLLRQKDMAPWVERLARQTTSCGGDWHGNNHYNYFGYKWHSMICILH